MTSLVRATVAAPFRLISSVLSLTKDPDSNDATTSDPDIAPIKEPGCLVDYVNNDYRGFIFVVHDSLGLLLLHCTRKKSKGPHFQIPGGHVDDLEFLQAGTSYLPYLL